MFLRLALIFTFLSYIHKLLLNSIRLTYNFDYGDQAIAEQNKEMAVSYTHLDVYKRQCYYIIYNLIANTFINNITLAIVCVLMFLKRLVGLFVRCV